MNKNFMILAASAVMLASCSNDETVDLVKGDAIQFRTAVNSRGEVLTNSSLKEFAVSAFLNDGSTYISDGIFKGSSTKFTSEADYRWPITQGAKLTFKAYAPVGIEGLKATATNLTIKDFTPPRNIADQKDFVTAVVDNPTAKTDKSVALTFSHHLTQVDICCATSMEGYNIYVTGVRIGRVVGWADFDLNKALSETNNESYATEKTYGWDVGALEVEEFDLSTHDPYSAEEPTEPEDPNARKVNYTTEYDEPILLTNELQSVMGKAGNALLIPQPLTNWNTYNSTYDCGSYIAVKIKVTNKDGALVFPATDKYEWVAASLNEIGWEAGKRYEYDLHFDQGFGHIDPEKGLDPEAPYDPNAQCKFDDDDPYRPGETIEEGKSITFSSSMTAWQDEYGTSQNYVNPNN